jgi:hypothetical protein
MALMLGFSTTSAFMNTGILLKIVAQTETIIKQQSIVQNKTGLGFVEKLDAMENSNINTLLELLSTIVETRINGTAALLELASKLPEVKNIQYVNSIDEKFMGISPDLDLQKRNIARYILEQDKDIATIFFLTPKGDIYIGEPYSDQEQLPRLNYVDRDWYKGVTKTNDTYVSATFLSAAIHVPAIAVAVPVYGNTTGNNVNANQTALSVVGYWVGIINPAGIKEDLSRLDLLGQSNKILLIDHNETQVVDLSSADNQNQSLKSYSQLQSVKNALNGKSGLALEMIDNGMTSVYYYPVYIHPHTWALLLLQPFG